MEKNERAWPIPVLVAALVAISTAAPLVKFAGEVHPVAIGFWRTFAVGLILATTIRLPHLRMPVRNWILTILAGAFLAGHFWSWFASLQTITALRSTVLVCLSPVWTGIIEGVILRKMPRPRYWIGVGIALAGVVLMSGGRIDDGTLEGDALALLGGFLGAIYLVVGSRVRQQVKIGPYGSIVCLSAALCLFLLSAPLEVRLSGWNWPIWIALGAIALGPQLTGHIGLNYVVRYIPASIVSIFLLLEPVGAAALAAVFLSEIPKGMEIIGATIILVGVAIGALGKRKKKEPRVLKG